MRALRDSLVGAVLAVVVLTLIHGPLASHGRLLLALFLALTACVYLGALLAQRQSMGVAGAELVVSSIVFACSFLGLTASVHWLAAGYLIHGAWDWAHHGGAVPTRVASWFPPLCAAFDLVVAGFVVLAANGLQ